MANNLNQRTALRYFMKQSKVLRFDEKMHNVENWCNNSIDFSIVHPELVEKPKDDGKIEKVADFNYIHRIEQEF